MLADGRVHAKACDLAERSCAPGCDWAALQEYLTMPTYWSFDQRAEARFAERSAALLRGEIPA